MTLTDQIKAVICEVIGSNVSNTHYIRFDLKLMQAIESKFGVRIPVDDYQVQDIIIYIQQVKSGG